MKLMMILWDKKNIMTLTAMTNFMRDYIVPKHTRLLKTE